MPNLSVSDIAAGTMITFRSKNPSDTRVWKGVLEGQGTYRLAKAYFNPQSYNEACRQIDPTIPSDVTLLNYFLITIDNSSATPLTLAFAREWIVTGSLAQINLGNQVTIRIDDPYSDTTKILSLLASAGYNSRIITS